MTNFNKWFLSFAIGSLNPVGFSPVSACRSKLFWAFYFLNCHSNDLFPHYAVVHSQCYSHRRYQTQSSRWAEELVNLWEEPFLPTLPHKVEYGEERNMGEQGGCGVFPTLDASFSDLAIVAARLHLSVSFMLIDASFLLTVVFACTVLC